jgi:hypothetical protein
MATQATPIAAAPTHMPTLVFFLTTATGVRGRYRSRSRGANE